jgi:SnoaL-like polyketide cyclase
MSAANKELSRRFTELFSTGDEALADEILSPAIAFHGTTADGELNGIDEMKAFVAGYRRAFPDARSTVETHRGELGPIPPTGRAFEIEGVTIERIAGGRIAEVWVARDELGLLRQLGLVPEPEAARA